MRQSLVVVFYNNNMALLTYNASFCLHLTFSLPRYPLGLQWLDRPSQGYGGSIAEGCEDELKSRCTA